MALDFMDQILLKRVDELAADLSGDELRDICALLAEGSIDSAWYMAEYLSDLHFIERLWGAPYGY